MAGSMSQADVLADLKASLGDAGKVFAAADDADWLRCLSVALQAHQAKRPRTLLGSVTLVADQDIYPLTVPDFAGYKTHAWGGRPLRPWVQGYPGALPRVCVQGSEGNWMLSFSFAPSAAHLEAYGSTFRFWYFATHTLATVAVADRGLLLLRAQAEALRELSMRNVNKPVSLRDGLSGTPRNSTPAALYQALLAEWEGAR